MLIIMGLLLAGAFILQGLFGFFQIKNFTRNYHELRKQGKVLIGRNPKKFRAGSLILMALDGTGKIKEARIMKGVTVFAKFKKIGRLHEKQLQEVAADYDYLAGFDRLTRRCILDAYRNYINFQTGKMEAGAFNTSVNLFSLPLLARLNEIKNKVLLKLGS
ncbi:transcriptional regulator GutM [Liquorilactobacillus satsumensis]|uniref:Sorbitol operon activator n=1 Tax=Liquorilactobacillus satsumensis DSM 16230 = JCM 12392 TaxID=1423801 RepID=A0A0R1UXB4_9LACO|nr:transcriptional regulator GutM [Liquorilactobacillus satsumensis]KRL97710.1 sorbitol operon activator [Liquorilactobacillus satsumensis DSM 16230 = JCM 12392]MCC7666526.1 transcriptional regulator [Liquorilactobacillus satsumensis]MCP9357508.1 transcriptional regulator GutM [Liquorilactobacillus satsumensis]MCP9371336.1 transcriptional regulator GutM [Liquorilactobacillus satsumensis]